MSIHDIYKKVFNLWREKRYKVFTDRLNPSSSDTLLDVGGYPWAWMARPKLFKKIQILNLDPIEARESYKDYAITTILADARKLPFEDKSYDIAFSNSVIEHVGDWSQQKAFASEILRVGKDVWVQTPAYGCPIEPHYLGLFVHYLPKRIQKAYISWFTLWGWIERPTSAKVQALIDEIRLLKKHEMVELFPGCDILTERLLYVLPKSYIAIRKTDRN